MLTTRKAKKFFKKRRELQLYSQMASFLARGGAICCRHRRVKSSLQNCFPGVSSSLLKAAQQSWFTNELWPPLHDSKQTRSPAGFTPTQGYRPAATLPLGYPSQIRVSWLLVADKGTQYTVQSTYGYPYTPPLLRSDPLAPFMAGLRGSAFSWKIERSKNVWRTEFDLGVIEKANESIYLWW